MYASILEDINISSVMETVRVEVDRCMLSSRSFASSRWRSKVRHQAEYTSPRMQFFLPLFQR